MSLKHYQDPEWSSYILEQAAEDTLAKTRQYNADADVWRLWRPEDIGALANPPVGGLLNKQYYLALVIPAAVATTVIRFRVPAGIGITFMGVWVISTAGQGRQGLGMGAVYELDVNTVKRQEIPLHGEKAHTYGFDNSGFFQDEWIRSIALEQFVFARQNDLVEINFFCKYGFTGQLEFWPIACIAGNRRQLLVAE